MCITVVKDMTITAFIDGGKYRDAEIYKVSKKLHEAGFVRMPDQIKYHWKTITITMYTGITLPANACKQIIPNVSVTGILA